MTEEQIKQAVNGYADEMEEIHRKNMNNEMLRHCIEFAVGIVIGFVVMFLIVVL